MLHNLVYKISNISINIWITLLLLMSKASYKINHFSLCSNLHHPFGRLSSHHLCGSPLVLSHLWGTRIQDSRILWSIFPGHLTLLLFKSTWLFLSLLIFFCRKNIKSVYCQVFIIYGVGRSGANIKKIEEKSGAMIHFKKFSEEDYDVCIIRGRPNATQIAESCVHDFIKQQPVIVEDYLLVPGWACGRIIGI